MVQIRPLTEDLAEYVRDESRTVGEAESISFPTTEAEVRDLLRKLHGDGTRHQDGTPGGAVPVTVQGARTGLAAGAVPHGGHVMNLSRMDRYLGLRRSEDGTFYLRVQPGVVLANLRKALANKAVPSAGWDEESLSALDALYDGPEQFFPTDPTETSACLGGIVACNASGARSYRYGPARPHVSALRVVLADGDVLALRRGEVHAQGRTLTLATEGGRTLMLDLPSYQMPHTKNASGYYVADDMDALDLFVGSDGTLGVITEIELALMPAPAVVWGASCFFESEAAALDFTVAARPRLAQAAAIEYFDTGALGILRAQRSQGAGFADLPDVPERFACCVYVELDCDTDEQALEQLCLIGDAMGEVGASEDDTWVARTDVDRERQRLFRHAAPECANMIIDERRRTYPKITKLGSDMSVPDDRLHDVVALYRRTLAGAGLESAAWGHIGANHLHVNVLPRNMEDFDAGKALFAGWAAEVTRMGGAVSAEHGVGKIKRAFLETMYGPAHIREMARLKRELDPAGQLGRGNLFDEDVLDETSVPKPPVSAGGSDMADAAAKKGGDVA
ncbi:FAD-linked oxidase C-terminal domain-containing protein [uncultured Parolsenella sp.]|uniref:FAD-binding oxidoreductase n=1 Tax=uncultured Parolsenella sp. TaxID=2083008 RepID=UPI0027D9C55F|nr:FAD-linked oxidase C-terminal domain-containing protein [uncultured Parolsenella sp.]